jgi:flagellar assembly protein FliH
MLMSNLTPKGQMSAFQRWEMASFGDERQSKLNDQAVLADAVSQKDKVDIDIAKENARREGSALGFREGYAQGIEEGKNAGKTELDAEIIQLQALIANFAEQVSRANQTIGQDLLDLAVDLAQAMTRSKFEFDPEIIIPIVRDAIEHLPSIHQPAQLFLHPADALILKNQMSEELDQAGWRVISDPHIERGGCKLETAQNLIDATFATRWQRLTEHLNRPPPAQSGAA